MTNDEQFKNEPLPWGNLPLSCGISLMPQGMSWSDLPPINLVNTVNSYPKNVVLDEPENLSGLAKKVVCWHRDRNLIDGSTDKDQFCKLMQEAGELSDSICKGKDIRDDIGDMLVVMLNITERNGISLDECLERAWQDIKDRKGRMVDGIFIKETDV